MKNLFFPLLIAFCLGATGACGIRKFSTRIGLIDIPNERSSHNRPTPKGGGVGIAATFVFFALWFHLPVGIWAPTIMLASVSLLADWQDISPAFRLFVQFAAASIVISSLPNTSLPHSLPLANHILVFIVYMTISAVFIVGTANFYNFMDGINGIAAITGIVAFSLLALAGHQLSGLCHWVNISLVITAACIGFLPFNFPKAQVFMGDVGSVTLGFVFATEVLRIADSLEKAMALASFLLLFYADELITMAERIKAKMPLTKPHRRHLYQVLANEMGISHWKVSLIYGIIQSIIGYSIWIAFKTNTFLFGSLLVISVVTFFCLNRKIKAVLDTKSLTKQ